MCESSPLRQAVSVCIGCLPLLYCPSFACQKPGTPEVVGRARVVAPPCDVITVLPFPLEQQELPARGNLSSAPAPAVPTALHSKMDELEGQLLAKVMALEKERAALSHGSHQQRQEVEKELDALQGRVAELEHGRFQGVERWLSCQAPGLWLQLPEAVEHEQDNLLVGVTVTFKVTADSCHFRLCWAQELAV